MNVSFSDHVGLLGQFLDRCQTIVDRLEAVVLNVQGKAIARSRDRRHLDREFTSCFFGVPGLPANALSLRGQLAARHRADGFEPVLIDRYSHELDPLELVARAYHHWEHHRWPGRSGRLAYATTIFAVFILRQLEHLSLRLWDEGTDRAGERLQDVQRLLDRLNAAASPNAFVRDARWLIQTAQGPLTRHLEPYFAIADHVSGSLTETDRLELHKAGARLAGGHLRSQLRYRVWNADRPMDDPELLAFMRNANSMDTALLLRDLVALLEAYEKACAEHEPEPRLDLADAILQGLSADPELYLTRLDLLAPCSMIETLFVERGDDGRARYTRRGEAHLALLERYGALAGRLAGRLKDDAAAFDPSRAGYSPLGISYGFCGDLVSNMALGTLHGPRASSLCLEDMFVSRGELERKSECARGWEALPTRDGEREHFNHSSEWAERMFARTVRALEERSARMTDANASNLPDATILVRTEPESDEPLPAPDVAAGGSPAMEYCFTSDLQRAGSSGATPQPKHQILTDRKEGRFLASAESDGKWFAISKIILTVFISQGRDALITGVPASTIEVLHLTCPTLVTVLGRR